MQLLERRREAAEADLRLQKERGRWYTQTMAIRATLARHRQAWTVGGGFAGGVLTGLLPIRAFARTASLLVGAVSFALRTPIGAMLLEGATLRPQRNPPDHAA